MPGHIILCPNPHRDKGLKLTTQARELLTGGGFETVVCPMFDASRTLKLPDGMETAELASALPGAKLIVVLGGDGTILHAARGAMGANVPIIGVNLGKKGMMAEIEADELPKLLDAARGKYTPIERMMLDVELIRDNETIFSDCALNDAVVRGVINVIRVTAFGDGEKIFEFSGDGIIIATPTGSTAYSMSAGGPFVEPDAENIILTPVCAHNLVVRSFVLAPEREVVILLEDLTGRSAAMSVDGGAATPLRTGDRLHIRKSAHHTVMADLRYKSFYEIVYEKLGDK